MPLLLRLLKGKTTLKVGTFMPWLTWGRKPSKTIYFLILYIFNCFFLTNSNTVTLCHQHYGFKISLLSIVGKNTIYFRIMNLTANTQIKILCTYAVHVKKWRKLLNEDLLAHSAGIFCLSSSIIINSEMIYHWIHYSH